MVNDVVAFFGGKKDGSANVGNTLETITKGDILVVDYNTGDVLSGAITAQTNPVIAVVGCVKDGEPMPSGPIYAKTAAQFTKTDYVAPVAQNSYVGVPAKDPNNPKVHNFSIVLFSELRLQPNRQDRLDFNIYSEGGEDLRDKLRDAINEAGNDNNPRLKAFKYVTATDGADATHLNITAEVLEKDNPVDQFSQVHFSIHGDDAFSVADTAGGSVDYVRGTGSGWETRDKEILHMGQWGYTDRRDTMRKEYPFVTELDNGYNILALSWQAPVRGDMQQQFQGPASVTIAFGGAAEDPAVTDQYDAVAAILQSWAESTYAEIFISPIPTP